MASASFVPPIRPPLHAVVRRTGLRVAHGAPDASDFCGAVSPSVLAVCGRCVCVPCAGGVVAACGRYRPLLQLRAALSNVV